MGGAGEAEPDETTLVGVGRFTAGAAGPITRTGGFVHGGAIASMLDSALGTCNSPVGGREARVCMCVRACVCVCVCLGGGGVCLGGCGGGDGAKQGEVGGGYAPSVGGSWEYSTI